MLDTLERSRVSRKLTAAEFRAQLWIGLTSEAGDLLPRYEIEWRQTRIDMNVPSDDATYRTFQIYDRAVGGEELLHGWLEPAIRSMRGCTVIIRLTCDFWPV